MSIRLLKLNQYMIILLSKIQKTIENILGICVCVESIFVYEMIKIAGKQPDAFWHGRAETITSNVIGISLIFAGIMISWKAFAEFGRGKTVGLLMIVGALVGIGSKWLLSYLHIYRRQKVQKSGDCRKWKTLF